MYLICPPKFCISIVFNFSWDSNNCNTQGEMENKGYAKFWGANKVHYGNCGSGIIGKTFVTHDLLNTKNIPCCMYTWIAQLPIIVFTCHYVYARSLGRGFTEHKVHRQTEVLLLSSLVRRLLALHNAWSILKFNWEQEQTFELSKEKGYLWMGHWRERREYRFPVNVQSIKMKCVYNYCVQRYEIYALIQSICNRSLPINTNLSIDCYWNSIPVNITTSIFAIDGSSIISSNRLIDIDWYRSVADWRNRSINITSLYAVIVNTFHFNALNVNRRTILSLSRQRPFHRVSVFLWQLKSLFSFLPPIHTYSMKTLTKNKNAWSLKMLSKVENYSPFHVLPSSC